MISTSSTVVLWNMVGKVNEELCICRGDFWSVGGISESGIRL